MAKKLISIVTVKTLQYPTVGQVHISDRVMHEPGKLELALEKDGSVVVRQRKHDRFAVIPAAGIVAYIFHETADDVKEAKAAS